MIYLAQITVDGHRQHHLASIVPLTRKVEPQRTLGNNGTSATAYVHLNNPLTRQVFWRSGGSINLNSSLLKRKCRVTNRSFRWAPTNWSQLLEHSHFAKIATLTHTWKWIDRTGEVLCRRRLSFLNLVHSTLFGNRVFPWSWRTMWITRLRKRLVLKCEEQIVLNPLSLDFYASSLWKLHSHF